MGLRFEWDGQKARRNLKKHGVPFEEAATVFGDPLSMTIADPLYSTVEQMVGYTGLDAARAVDRRGSYEPWEHDPLDYRPEGDATREEGL